MMYLDNVWVNWSTDGPCSYHIPKFHEWTEEEVPRLLEKVPLLRVDPCVFTSISNSNVTIPTSWLQAVKGKAVERDRVHRKIIQDYIFALTDQTQVLVIHTEGTNYPVFKSYTTPQVENIALTLANKLPVSQPENVFPREFSHPSHPYPLLEEMTGLTRKERKLKQMLKEGMQQLESASLAEIQYFYSEWNISRLPQIKQLSKEDLLAHFDSELASGWTANHQTLLTVFLKWKSSLLH